MEELKKLVQIIQKRGASDSQLLNFKLKRPNKEWLLFDGLANGLIKSEEDALSLLYPEDSSTAAFKMVKSRLRKKLMNQLFFLDFQGNSIKSSHTLEQECLAKLYQARVLINSGAYDLSLPLLRQVLATAQDYDFNDIASLALRSLLHTYTHLGERTLFYKVNEQLKELVPILSADQEAERLFLESKVELNHSISARKNHLAKVESVLKRLEELWLQAQSYPTFDYYYLLSIWAQELSGNFHEIVELTNASEELLQSKKVNAERFDHRYNKFIQVYAHLRAKKLEEGIRLASQYEASFNPSSNNWFAFMENYTLLALHARQYEIAHMVLHKVLSNPFFKKITRMAQERWSLFEAYLHLVAPQRDKPFKWQNLVQNVPSYSKDKEGFNVAILILQVLYYVDMLDTEALEYRMEALKKYAHKHFKDSFSERSRIFFKLLALVVKADFDYIVAQKKGENLCLKLQNTNPPGDAYAEIEIIPYEHLWELIIERLKKREE
ncbi:hypothetical protein TH61_16175 [Rufibacter sp. DG15C]|uniref:hypothetical protein n=1 Tax=Rufibacter sp. DG15C TaxID=1379909 RepID=UPI00078E4026|nr:hypothetical protein [Rufibacter sp. DG15C]AMM52417.1 hypothetical protein TH61_16175 [Rufibacter sp. DG15C]